MDDLVLQKYNKKIIPHKKTKNIFNFHFSTYLRFSNKPFICFAADLRS